jgi:hypothetical protein
MEGERPVQGDNIMPHVGSIIVVRYNDRSEPAVVCRHLEHGQVLVHFINDDVVYSNMNFRYQFGNNIALIAEAHNYIPYSLENVLQYTNFLNLDELMNRFYIILEDINTGNLMLNRVRVQRRAVAAQQVDLPLAHHPNCNINYASIPSVDIDVDLSGQVCPFTQDEFQFGQEYYRVTIELPGPNNTLVTNVSYFSINDLQIWFCANQRDMRCRHPLYNVEFSLDDVRRFTYRRPPQCVQRKRRSKISNNKRIKRSRQRI